MEYSIVRSARRTLAVEIDREGKVTVRAPKRCPRSTIDSFLDRKSDWIAQHIQMQLERSAAHPEPNEERRRQLIEKARSVLPAVAPFSASMRIAGTRRIFQWYHGAITHRAENYLRTHQIWKLQRAKQHLLFMAADGVS